MAQSFRSNARPRGVRPLLAACRFRPRRLAAALLLGLLSLLPWGFCGQDARAAAPGNAARPNIVFVLLDDLEAAALGSMPQVRQLARSGATFTRAFATTPMCVPSRATILTGKYPQNTGVHSNRPPSGGYQLFYQNGNESRTVAVWLQQAGYRTALIGKYINYYPDPAGPLHVPEGWSYWAVPDQGKVHAKYGYRLNENGRYVSYGHAPEDYATDVYASKVLAFIEQAADEGTPFALFFTPASPHLPEVAAVRHARLFTAVRAPRVASFPETDTRDKPPFMRLPFLTVQQVAELDERYRLRLRMLQSVDEAVGAIRKLLATRGLLDNTYIVVTADHGWHQGEHNQMPGKGRPYDEDIRIPLVVSGPGIPPGRRISRLIGNADFAPTFAHWAGIPPPTDVDGRSFASLAASANPAAYPWRKRLPIMRTIEGTQVKTNWPAFNLLPSGGEGYACLQHLPAGPAWPAYRGVRTARHTYVEHHSGHLELYNNQLDPHQLENSICSSSSGLRAKLHQATVSLSTCRAASCRTAEDR